MKIVTVIGARPQFIKAATVSRVIRDYNLNNQNHHIQEIIVHTGQHYDDNMSKIFFDDLDIPHPDYNCEIGSGMHGAMTGKMLEKIEQFLIKERPDWVLVYGDTNSTLAGALAASKLNIRVAHVEAGLRSFNRHMPEEINRVLTDHVSDFLFTPTKQAVANLMNEGIAQKNIMAVGDVMYDASLFYSIKADQCSTILKKLNLNHSNYLLATIHRAENTDKPARLSAIFENLRDVSKVMNVVLPLHPRTHAALKRNNLLDTAEEFLMVIEPLGYLDMVALEKNATVIATDSGGVQKEAFFYRVPCITLREETEWVELIELGWNRLAPPCSGQSIAETIINAKYGQEIDNGPYGDGRTAENIVSKLLKDSALI